MKTIRVWLREDGEPPAILAVTSSARGPGRVFDVAGAQRRAEAIDAVTRFLSPEPDEDLDPGGFLLWRKAQRHVTEVIGG